MGNGVSIVLAGESRAAWACAGPPQAVLVARLSPPSRRVNREALLALGAVRALVERGLYDVALNYLDDAIEVAKSSTHDDSKALRSARNRRYYGRHKSPPTVLVPSESTSESVLEASEVAISDLRSYSNSKEIKERDREHNSDASQTRMRLISSVSKSKREHRERPPEFANDAERDAWCYARGLPVGHASLERFLAEQRNCRQGKLDWRRAWQVNEPRITNALQDEAAKRSRLNGGGPGGGAKPAPVTQAQFDEECRRYDERAKKIQ